MSVEMEAYVCRFYPPVTWHMSKNISYANRPKRA